MSHAAAQPGLGAHAVHALIEALRAHRPGDALEAGHRQRVIELLQGTEAPFSREQMSPGHITASAFVLSPAGTSLLLIHHRKLGRWLQPGGHLDAQDESVLMGALREVQEETGAEVTAEPGVFDVDVHPIPAKGSEPAHHHFDIRYLFRATAWDLTPQKEEVRGVRWVELEELDKVGTDPSVRRAVVKLAQRRQL